VAVARRERLFVSPPLKCPRPVTTTAQPLPVKRLAHT
jgi:hypothetical protein